VIISFIHTLGVVAAGAEKASPSAPAFQYTSLARDPAPVSLIGAFGSQLELALKLELELGRFLGPHLMVCARCFSLYLLPTLRVGS
jgi:hypothetical protein